jgi:hypothetical protein
VESARYCGFSKPPGAVAAILPLRCPVERRDHKPRLLSRRADPEKPANALLVTQLTHFRRRARTPGDLDLCGASRDHRADNFTGIIAMPFNKPHLEFQRIDMNDGWFTPPGYPAGIQQKTLASDLDETKKMGSRTRLLRFDPGVYTTAPFVHDHWEEVYLVSGDLIVGNDTKGQGGEAFEAPTYACRPPGVYHGPFKSDRGCLLYEIHYYDETKK